MSKDIFYASHGFCEFINSDPVALAYQVIDKKVFLRYDVKGMLVQRLLRISGEPSIVVPMADSIVRYYDIEAKADVADLAVRIRYNGDEKYGRAKDLDSDGLYAVTV
jgi:hypothetical protein